MKYQKDGRLASIIPQEFKVFTYKWTFLSFENWLLLIYYLNIQEIVIKKCFSIAIAQDSNFSIAKLTSRSKLVLVILISHTDSFNILITRGWYFLSKVVLAAIFLLSKIHLSKAVMGIKIQVTSKKLSLIGYHSPKFRFLSAL